MPFSYEFISVPRIRLSPAFRDNKITDEAINDLWNDAKYCSTRTAFRNKDKSKSERPCLLQDRKQHWSSLKNEYDRLFSFSRDNFEARNHEL